jgi:hypothetical protein
LWYIFWSYDDTSKRAFNLGHCFFLFYQNLLLKYYKLCSLLFQKYKLTWISNLIKKLIFHFVKFILLIKKFLNI